MKSSSRNCIPAGTKVEIRNLKDGGELRQHVTRIDLLFDDRAGTGYSGRVFYFRQGDWLIAVNADLVR